MKDGPDPFRRVQMSVRPCPNCRETHVGLIFTRILSGPDSIHPAGMPERTTHIATCPVNQTPLFIEYDQSDYEASEQRKQFDRAIGNRKQRRKLLAKKLASRRK